jgi:hypothetical protein
MTRDRIQHALDTIYEKVFSLAARGVSGYAAE